MAPVGGGLAIVETMGKAARGLGVEFHFETTARSLVTGDTGVEGVVADTPVGPRSRSAAGWCSPPAATRATPR